MNCLKFVSIALNFVTIGLGPLLTLQVESIKFIEMDKFESLEDFYKRKFNWLPDNFRKEAGHFNIFRLEPYVEGKQRSQF